MGRWLTGIILTWHMNNRNRSGSDLAARNPSFWHRASSPGVMVEIVQDLLTVSAVELVATVMRGDKRFGSCPHGANVPLEQQHQKRP